MLTRNRLIGFVLVAALLLAAAPAVFAAFSPEVFAINQPVVDNMVRVTRATTDGPGWLVIHADEGGKPGPIIGYAALPSGINANVFVSVDPAGVTDVLYAMLHTDADKVGEFEYPEGKDAPVMQGDKIVMQKFDVTGVETTVVNQIAQEDGLTTLASAIEAAGLTDALRKEAAVTIFAPSDAAFAALPKADLDALLADPAQLADVLAYHVLPASLAAADLESGEQESLQGSPLLIDVQDGAVTVNGAQVITPDVAAANGVVHIIDTVLVPPAPVTEAVEATAPETAPNLADTAAAAGSFTTLLKAVEAAGLTDALAGTDPLTVFAPSDDAFAALPKETLDALLADPEALAEVLKYHILPGTVMAADVVDGMSAASLSGEPLTFATQNGGITVNGAKIVTPDVTAGNGVIHVIDQVLMPPAATPEASPAETATAAAPADTIATVAAKSGQFETLLAAAEAAGLADALNGPGPLTIFAPTDDAFAAVPSDLLDSLLKNPAALKDVLLYHVVLDKLPAANLPAAGIATNAQGNLLVFTTADGKIFVNGAEIVQPDIEAGNGLIHVIDEVLLPPPSTGEDTAVASPAPAPTNTPTPAPTDTPTAAPTNTPTSVPSTNTPTPVPPTNTPTPVPPTNTPTPKPTNTPTPVPPTNTPTPKPTNTPTPVPPTNTPTPVPPTNTPTPVPPTNTPTPVPPTNTPTPKPTNTPTPVPPTNTPTVAPAAVVTEVTAEATVEATPEVTAEATVEATPEVTAEATVEATPEVTAEATVEATPEASAEATPAVDPDELPTSGGEFSGGSTTMLLVAGVLVLLVGGAYVTRRRPA